MNNEEIKKYIADERVRGVREEDIKKELSAKGWKEEDITIAMSETGASGGAPLPPGSIIPVGDLVSRTFKEMTDHFVLIASIMAIPIIAYAIPTISFVVFKNELGYGYSAMILPIVFALVGFVLLILSIIGIMKQMRLGWTLSVGDTYKSAVPYFWSMLWVSLLSGFVVFGGAILLIIPGIIVGIMLVFARPAVVLDDIKGMAALSWSGELVKDIWWGIFLRMLVVGLLVAIFDMLMRLIPYVGVFSTLFTLPFATIYTVLLYDNIKAYKRIAPAQTVGKNKGLYMGFGILGAVAIPVLIFIFFVMIAGFSGLMGGGMDRGIFNPNDYDPIDLVDSPEAI